MRLNKVYYDENNTRLFPFVGGLLLGGIGGAAIDHNKQYQYPYYGQPNYYQYPVNNQPYYYPYNPYPMYPVSYSSISQQSTIPVNLTYEQTDINLYPEGSNYRNLKDVPIKKESALY